MLEKPRSKVIGGVVLLNVIGKGAHSEVQRGLFVVQGKEQEVAVKIVSKASLSVRLVEDEIALLRRINHPNVVTFFNRCETSNNHYLVTELCARGNFREFVRCTYRENCVPEEHARYYLHQVCLGLGEIHRQNIAHRDLKAENIFITDDFVIKIGDFGFAKQSNELSILSSFKGTPVNMAPEIFYAHRKKGAFYDKKCDIWSLGTLLYEMIYGHVIGDVKNVNDLHVLLNNEKEVQLPVNKHISSSCRSLLHLLLRKKPSDRPQISEVLAHNFFDRTSEALIYVTNLLRDVTTSLNASTILDDEFFDTWHFEYFISVEIKKLLKEEVTQLVSNVFDIIKKVEKLSSSANKLPKNLSGISSDFSTYILYHIHKLNSIITASPQYTETISAYVCQLIEENKERLGMYYKITQEKHLQSQIDDIRKSFYSFFFEILEENFKFEFSQETFNAEERAQVRFAYEYAFDLFKVISFDYTSIVYRIKFLRPLNVSFDPMDINRYFKAPNNDDKIFSVSAIDFLHTLMDIKLCVIYETSGVSAKLASDIKHFISLVSDKRLNSFN